MLREELKADIFKLETKLTEGRQVVSSKFLRQKLMNGDYVEPHQKAYREEVVAPRDKIKGLHDKFTGISQELENR